MSRWYPLKAVWVRSDVMQGVDDGSLTTSQETFADVQVEKYSVSKEKGNTLSVAVRSENLDENAGVKYWPYRELVGSFVWLAVLTRPNNCNALWAVARCCATPKYVHRLAAWGNMSYIRGMSTLGPHRRGCLYRIKRSRCPRKQTAPVRQLTGERPQEVRSREEVNVSCGFRGLRSV